jgi:hypothetical protein
LGSAPGVIDPITPVNADKPNHEVDTKNGLNNVTPPSQPNPNATNPIPDLVSISISCRYHQPGARYFPSRVRVKVQTRKDPPSSCPIGTLASLFRFPLFCFFVPAKCAKCGSPPAARPPFPTSRPPHGTKIIAVESTSQGPGKCWSRVLARIGALLAIYSGTALPWCANCRFCFPQRWLSCFWVETISRMMLSFPVRQSRNFGGSSARTRLLAWAVRGVSRVGNLGSRWCTAMQHKCKGAAVIGTRSREAGQSRQCYASSLPITTRSDLVCAQTLHDSIS